MRGPDLAAAPYSAQKSSVLPLYEVSSLLNLPVAGQLVLFRGVILLGCISEYLSGASSRETEPESVQNADDGLGVGHAAAADHGVPSYDRGGQVKLHSLLKSEPCL